MPRREANPEALQRLYTRGIPAKEIAEAFVSLDVSTPLTEVRSFQVRHEFDVVGVSRDGKLVGFVTYDGPPHKTTLAAAKRFHNEDILGDEAPLSDVIEKLRTRPQVFIVSMGTVGGIVTRADLQKIPIRIWLFGLISLFESELLRILRGTYTEAEWKAFLGRGRVSAASRIYNDRKTRNEQIGLIDCIGLKDKFALAIDKPLLAQRLGLSDPNERGALIDILYNLRNELAHSNKVMVADWETFFKTILELRRLINRAVRI